MDTWSSVIIAVTVSLSPLSNAACNPRTASCRSMGISSPHTGAARSRPAANVRAFSRIEILLDLGCSTGPAAGFQRGALQECQRNDVDSLYLSPAERSDCVQSRTYRWPSTE